MNMNLALDDLEKDIALLQGLIINEMPKKPKLEHQKTPQIKKTYPQVENIEDNLEIALKQAEVDKIQLEIVRNELEQQELIEAADDRHHRLVQSMMNQVQHLDQNYVLDILKILGSIVLHSRIKIIILQKNHFPMMPKLASPKSCKRSRETRSKLK
jgi:hypothetical protein